MPVELITDRRAIKPNRVFIMPPSAIASGCIDFVLPPEGIAREIARMAHSEVGQRDLATIFPRIA